ncbi:GNAT family N-acetyltransferase [Labrys monachus]|uniref:Ribosomal protein S18 acetylase RimI-like enzyme n=1 Tax=Labrys monachus TaxID=217067 RepID=A0ABU0FKA9_9HYPH|nr:GNAT family N-acetyltransferase [Labrys monachus]MDQ0395048.1 ribosomal protein S18 acetylase RimI-like enzyme [Labrys monachus]
MPAPLLARRVEEACLAGWPALTEILFDGWLLRFSRGHTRRANSISLLAPSTEDIAGKVGRCEALYARQGLPTIFRLSTLGTDPVDAVLDERGYGPREDEAVVLHRDLAPAIGGSDAGRARIEEGPSRAWLDALARIQGLGDDAKAANDAIFAAIAVPAGFAASLSAHGDIAAVAFGAVHRGIVCINAVATDPAFRRRGHARAAVVAILDWARSTAGAGGACLPVMAGNDAARGLYEALGFRTEVSRYAYRRQR